MTQTFFQEKAKFQNFCDDEFWAVPLLIVKCKTEFESALSDQSGMSPSIILTSDPISNGLFFLTTSIVAMTFFGRFWWFRFEWFGSKVILNGWWPGPPHLNTASSPSLMLTSSGYSISAGFWTSRSHAGPMVVPSLFSARIVYLPESLNLWKGCEKLMEKHKSGRSSKTNMLHESGRPLNLTGFGIKLNSNGPSINNGPLWTNGKSWTSERSRLDLNDRPLLIWSDFVMTPWPKILDFQTCLLQSFTVINWQ